jgi:hypothetical protein
LLYEWQIKGKSLNAIKIELNKRGIENRNRKPFSRNEIGKLLRPIFSGYIRSLNGILVKSKWYPEILSFDEYKKAINKLQFPSS